MRKILILILAIFLFSSAYAVVYCSPSIPTQWDEATRIYSGITDTSYDAEECTCYSGDIKTAGEWSLPYCDPADGGKLVKWRYAERYTKPDCVETTEEIQFKYEDDARCRTCNEPIFDTYWSSMGCISDTQELLTRKAIVERLLPCETGERDCINNLKCHQVKSIEFAYVSNGLCSNPFTANLVGNLAIIIVAAIIITLIYLNRNKIIKAVK